MPEFRFITNPKLKTAMKRISSPEGIADLIRNLWLRHLYGLPQERGHVFLIELPPAENGKYPTPSRPKEITDETLRDAVAQLGGW